MARVPPSFVLAAALGCGPSVEVSSASGETSGSADGSTGTTMAPTTSATAEATSSPTTTTTSADTTSTSDDTVDEGIIDDFPALPDIGTDCLVRGKLGARVFGNVWVGDVTPGTISKIDHATLVELARYLVAPAGGGILMGNLSVSRNGDVVASDLFGGATMIRAECEDLGNTSSGPEDVRPWPDDCVAWHVPAEDTTKAIAWTGGELDPRTCRYVDSKVWITAKQDDVGSARLVDGETGVLEDVADFVGLDATGGGLWSAAVDSADNLWATEVNDGVLVRVDRETLEVETWAKPLPSVGIAIDHNDRVWSCDFDIMRFDYPTQTWDMSEVPGNGGCTPGYDDTMWTSGGFVRAIDIDTLEEVDATIVPGGAYGIAMDFDGYLWTATLGDTVKRIETMNGVVDQLDGFGTPEAVGDFTGTALAIVKGDL